MFDVYLESVKRNVEACARLGLIDSTERESIARKKVDDVTPFPPYLAASFLSIVRCRAQVERALREATVRNAEGNGATYLFLALQTASDGTTRTGPPKDPALEHYNRASCANNGQQLYV